MNQHRYTEPLPKLQLESKKRFRVKHCPCGKSNKDGKFVPYAGFENKGYCHSCGKTFLPDLPKVEQWQFDTLKPKQARIPQPKPVSFIPVEIFRKSRSGYDKNHFTKFLLRKFDADTACNLISRYHIGTSKHWEGATVFWQIDRQGKVRTGKIMLYNPNTGKRYKDKFQWAHKLLNIENFNLKQCFFGEHLLQDKTKPVAIFESEKTAIIASVYFPELICIACGGLQGLSPEKCKVLRGRNVILYPDLSAQKPGNPSAFEIWSEKKKELQRLFPGTRFNVSSLLERKATEAERQQGLDLADYLIRFDYREFQQQEQPEAPKSASEQPQQAVIKTMRELQPVEKNKEITTKEPETPVVSEAELPKPACPVFIGENWEQDITELEHYFETATLPAGPVKLNQCSTITDVPKFIDGHLATVKAQNGKRTFLPYLERLQQLSIILKTTSLQHESEHCTGRVCISP